MKTLRVLLAEDSENDAILLVRQLRREGYEPVWKRVETWEQMREAIRDADWDVVIADHSMPRLSSAEILQTLRESGRDIPTIIVSGTIGEAAAVEAMRAGARDYFVKGALGRLVPAIEREIRESRERRRARKTEEQLRQAQKMESIGRLAGGVAHDFNNLLTAILGLADLSLRELPPESNVRADLQEIKQTALRAAALTRQLLAFSRQQIIQPRLVDLNEVVRNLEKILRRLIEEDIAIQLVRSPGVAATLADPSQLEQLILNMAVNARDAMPHGGTLTLAVSRAVIDDAFALQNPGAVKGEYVLLSVRDTGVGIAEEARPHLFEPFYTTKEPGKGTGLGLATCYGIVKQNRGYIRVESALGKGTSFHVYLPKAQGTPEPLNNHEGGPRPSLRGDETVLLVEDESAVRRLAARVLSEHGYRVWEAADGARALKAVREDDARAIRLLLTDTVMPNMGGKALAGEVAKLRPDIKVVFMSGYTDESIARHGVLDPGVDFINKPFEPKALLQKVRDALDRA